MWNKGLVMLQGPLPPTCNLGGPARAYPYIEHRARGPQQGRPHIEHRAGGPSGVAPRVMITARRGDDNSPSLRRWLPHAVGSATDNCRHYTSCWGVLCPRHVPKCNYTLQTMNVMYKLCLVILLFCSIL